MNADEMLRMESEQKQFHETMIYQERLNVIIETQEYNLFNLLKPKIYKDGNKWCVLLGKDIQVGISGFGDSPYLAILDWNKAMSKKVESL